MKLLVSRNQKKTLTSGIHFVVTFKLQLSGEETELVKKYGQTRRKLGEMDVWSGAIVAWHSTYKDGIEYETDNVGNALAVEERMKKDCANLKAYIETASAYGGVEEFDF
jgi:hypothetical protein